MNLFRIALQPYSSAERWGVGISGGADSVALIHGLVRAGFGNLVVCHVEHGIRGAESLADAEFVRELALSLSLPFLKVSADVPMLALERKVSVETAAREVRLGAFSRWQQEYALSGIFLAHHQRDVAETLLMNLLRGSSRRGLAGMRADTHLTQPSVRLLRPLLGISPESLRAWLVGEGIPWREDATNAEPHTTRNRVRLELLPMLRAIFQRDPISQLSKTARALADEEAWIEAQVPELWREEKLEIPALLALPLPLRRRAVYRWLRVRGTMDVDAEDVEAALNLTHEIQPAKVNLARGWHLRRTAGKLWLEPPL